ncbi:MAG: hypothetical protein ACP6IS_00985 [Candidatus Asgardarchaeia archaeon]
MFYQLMLPKGTRDNPKATSYCFRVHTAFKYLRNRDFLHYGPSFVPEKIGAHTWTLAWAYIREIDDILDDPDYSYSLKMKILEHEKEVIKDVFSNNFKYNPNMPFRYAWLEQFLDNVNKYYDSSVLNIIWELYKSAVRDVNRRFRILSQKEMYTLVYQKATCFFKLYFTLGQFDLGDYLDELADMLGRGLGILDDALDFIIDFKSGYINVTKEELKMLDIDVSPEDEKFIRELINRGYYTLKSIEVMKLFLRAREIARELRNPLFRNLILRLTEIFAAPVLEGRFFPGQRYFFKGEKILNKLLPYNEHAAYRIGHKLIGYILKIPQVSPSLFDAFRRALLTDGKVNRFITNLVQRNMRKKYNELILSKR